MNSSRNSLHSLFQSFVSVHVEPIGSKAVSARGIERLEAALQSSMTANGNRPSSSPQGLAEVISVSAKMSRKRTMPRCRNSFFITRLIYRRGKHSRAGANYATEFACASERLRGRDATQLALSCFCTAVASSEIGVKILFCGSTTHSALFLTSFSSNEKLTR